MTHPSPKRNMVPKAVLMRSGLVSLTTAKPVNTAQPRTTVNSARPMTTLSKSAHSTGNPQMDLQDKGVIDSGCSRHMTGNMSYLTDYEEIDGGYVTFGGNPKGEKITGRGTIKTGNLDFENVYFVKELKFNLFSVSQMCDKKNSVLFNDTECIVLSPNFKLTDESHVLLKVPRKNNMYSVDLKNIVPKGGLTCLFAKATSDESELWHRRLGHINFKTMNKLVKGNLVRGLPSKLFENNQTCVACQKGKQHRASFVTDDYSRFSWVFFLATKDETSGILKSFITRVENLIDQRVKVIRCDNGTEFKNKEMNQFCERKGRKPALGFVRPFWCPVTILNTIDHLGKFDGKADEGFFVGYSINISGPKWLFDINALTKSMNYKPIVVGNQSNGNAGTKACDDAGKARMQIVPGKDYIMPPLWPADLLFSQCSKSSPDVGFKPLSDGEKKVDGDPSKEDERDDQEKGDSVNSTNNINNASDGNSTNNVNVVSSSVNVVGIEVNAIGTKTSIELLDDPNMPELEDIVYSDDDEDRLEFSTSNKKNDKEFGRTWKSFYNSSYKKFRPWWIYQNGKRAIGTKWVYRNKKDERDIVIKNKARLVAQEYTQEEGIDYDEVFAPVAKIEAIRLFLAYASFKDFVVYQMNVKSAFLYGKIEEEFYDYQPPRFEDPDFPDRVYKVEKALYGLHQALRVWYETLSTYLLDNRFQRGKIDKTLFIKRDKGDILLVQVYVDDIIFGSTKKSLCTEFEKMMHKKFQMSSIGELTFFLGMQVKKKEDGIFISQDKYVTEILKKFGFTDVKTASTPMETQKPLLKDEDGEEVDVHLYRSMIGSLMYLTSSRPDIMFTVCACARYQVSPKVTHLHAVNRIFRYLKGQPKLGLWYPKDSPFDLPAYTNIDYAGESLDRKSTIGGCQFLRCRLISWQCKKQTVVANCIIVSEYVAASIKNPIFHSKTKHIEIRHHFIRDSNEKKLIQMIKIHTDKNVADLLTKAFDVKTVNEVVQLQALVDGKKIIITEETKLTFYKAFFSPQWKFLIHTILQCLSAKTTAWNEFSSTMASAIICLARNQKFNFSKYIFESLAKNLDNADEAVNEEPSMQLKELMDFCTKLQQRVLDLENTKTAQAQEITSLKLRVKRLEKKGGSRTHKLKRLYKIGRSTRVVSSNEASLGNQEDASKQRRKTDDIDADITLVDETQGRHDDDLMFNTCVLNDEEVFAGQDMAEKEVSTADPVNTAGEVVTTANVEVSTASLTAATITNVELTLAQTLAELKSARPKTKGVVMQEPSESTPTISLQLSSQAKEEALRLQAAFDEEDRLARDKAQQVEEANIVWDDIQAKIDVDYQLAKRLEAQEQHELTIEEKSTLFQQLLEKRRKFFEAKRAEEKRNRLPTRAQQRSIMCTYLKNIAGWKPKDLKNKSFVSIQELFDKAMIRVNTFVDMDIELVEGNKVRVEGSETREESSSQRAGDELEQDKVKKQKVDDDQEAAKMKELMKIVPDEEEVAVDAIPLATKPPSVVDYKIIKEGKINNYLIIRADGSSKRPEEGYNRVLWGDLKTMYEHHVEDLGRIVGIKRLIDDFRVTAAQLMLLVQKLLLLVLKVNVASTNLQLLKD
ncbi:putative ribonuclease H-like domain-containing protein [Tanacetum coccineum]